MLLPVADWASDPTVAAAAARISTLTCPTAALDVSWRLAAAGAVATGCKPTGARSGLGAAWLEAEAAFCAARTAARAATATWVLVGLRVKPPRMEEAGMESEEEEAVEEEEAAAAAAAAAAARLAAAAPAAAATAIALPDGEEEELVGRP